MSHEKHRELLQILHECIAACRHLKKIIIVFVVTTTIVFLTACSVGKTETNPETNKDIEKPTETKESASTDSNSHENMNHSGSGEVPKELKIAENPTYSIGSKVIVQADHMKGMKSAEATIVGAYSTTAYVVSYTPTTGGEEVKNHKWVIQEEIEGADDKALEPGSKVTLKANHMKGMEGATATIDSSEKTTVYMIDYFPTSGGEEVKNHKWVTESELSSK